MASLCGLVGSFEDEVGNVRLMVDGDQEVWENGSI
jgi:hypothetical protein